MEGIPGAIPLMQNTDGLETMIPDAYIDKYLEICSEWEKTTQLELEHNEYQKLILADVNNYIAINKFKEVSEEKFNELNEEYPHGLFKKEDGKFFWAPTKCKGRFEFENLALHKNKSFLIVPKALFAYFIKDVPPEQFLQDNRNIFDYCGGVKIKGDWEFQQICVSNQQIVKAPLQKTLRYYISERGCKIIKAHKQDGREIQLESGKWMQQLFNVFEEKPWKDYDIDESYYLDKIYKEIRNILPPAKKQLSLF
ncbi:MAG: hypothetical protein E6R13_09645 [Spirochaetes bacterium]|nr:MAG: hypothetical protein E6R13_09645 [Spirochaetota bacterium]